MKMDVSSSVLLPIFSGLVSVASFGLPGYALWVAQIQSWPIENDSADFVTPETRTYTVNPKNIFAYSAFHCRQ
jgi:hypothetical protein